MDRTPSTGLLLLESPLHMAERPFQLSYVIYRSLQIKDFLEIFFGQKIFYRSSMTRGPSSVFFQKTFYRIEDLLQVFYGQRTFYKSFMARDLLEDLLQVFYCQKGLNGQKTSFVYYMAERPSTCLRAFLCLKNPLMVFYSWKTVLYCQKILHRSFIARSSSRRPSSELLWLKTFYVWKVFFHGLKIQKTVHKHSIS